MAGIPVVECIFHKGTSTCTYVVMDPATKDAAVIDSVLDFTYSAAKTSTEHIDAIVKVVKEQGANVKYILETHVHADHLSGAKELRKALGLDKVPICIGFNIGAVQHQFKEIYNLEKAFPEDGRQFDKLFKDGEEFKLGSIPGRVIHTPGHTPACMTYNIGDALFCGDTIFMPDFGTARCDFPGGSTEDLWNSIQKLLAFPDNYRIFTAHDYQPGGRELRYMATVAEQKASNKHVKTGTKKEEFIKWRNERDAQLNAPGLILPSIQVNIRAGDLPEPESNGAAYLKIPLNSGI